jgi:transglutaminase-like putative cysteine protease
MNKTALFICLFFICSALSAQKFGKVDKIEFNGKFHPLYPEAPAAYLFHNGKANIRFENDGYPVLLIQRHDRIRIYAEEGIPYAISQIELYNQKREKEKITGLKVTTSNLVRGKVVKSKMKKKEMMQERVAENWTVVSFTPPDLKVGAIVDISYTIVSPFVSMIPPWYFQTDIPVDISYYEVSSPYDFPYIPNNNGTIKLEIETKSGRNSFSGYDNYKFIARQVPPIHYDEMVLSMEDYISSVSFQLEPEYFSINNWGLKRDDWATLGKKLLRTDFMTKALQNNYKFFTPLIEKSTDLSEDEKIALAYNYIQKEVTWDRSYTIGNLEGPDDIIKTRKGSNGDINLLLINLLRKMGVQADPVLTKCKNHGILNTAIPSLSDFNYLFAIVTSPDGQQVLLDASSKFVPVGQLPNRALNAAGLLLTTNGSRLVKVSSPNEYRTSGLSTFSISEDKKSLVGTNKTRYTDYAATRYRIDLNDKATAEGCENELIISPTFDEDLDKYVPTKVHFDTTNLNEIIVDSDQELASVIRDSGDSIIINSALNFGISENPFTETERLFPVFYGHASTVNHVATIELPAGYRLADFPDDVALALPDEDGKFTYQVKATEDDITIYYQLQINKDYFSIEQYPALREFYDRIFKLQNEKLVFVKK